MKNTVLILSKTQMENNHVCVGGITLEGRYVRLLTPNGDNQPMNTDFAIRQLWEIEFNERKNNIPPHIEDIIVLKKTAKDEISKDITIRNFIEERNIPIWRGHPDNLFDKLIKWTSSGSGFIDKIGRIPSNSVGFWISDKDLKKIEYQGIRFRYPNSSDWRSIKYKGLEVPIEIIPAGTLIRVSLARWYSFNEEDKPKCWLQLSGWYDI